jgi:hypothetical protein
MDCPEVLGARLSPPPLDGRSGGARLGPFDGWVAESWPRRAAGRAQLTRAPAGS